MGPAADRAGEGSSLPAGNDASAMPRKYRSSCKRWGKVPDCRERNNVVDLGEAGNDLQLLEEAQQ